MRRRSLHAPGPLALALVFVLFAAWSCARPVRQVASLDPSVPAGRIEGTTFVGIRLPMTISTAGTDWEISTTYPEFLLDQGYEKEGLEQSDLFVYNPRTRSNLQISFSPADAYTRYSQRSMEFLSDLGGASMKSELDGEFGSGNYTMTLGETRAYPLDGVPFAARNEVQYESGSVKRENGWIYAFAEPFQIFLLYQLNDLGGNNDSQDLEKILSSFRYTGPPGSP